MSGRGLEYVELLGPDENGDPVFRCLCDCATVTDVTLARADVMLQHGAVQEIAYTCDGCESAHWMTIAISQ